MVGIRRATQEMREKLITPIEFLQKISHIDNKIMKASSEDNLINEIFDNSVASNSDSSDSDDDQDSLNCIICEENKLEVLLMPCSHICCCKMCWEKQQKNVDSKGRPICPISNCNLAVKKFTFVDI